MYGLNKNKWKLGTQFRIQAQTYVPRNAEILRIVSKARPNVVCFQEGMQLRRDKKETKEQKGENFLTASSYRPIHHTTAQGRMG
jgi:hypothetical protein